jgi:hypothetical protein
MSAVNTNPEEAHVASGPVRSANRQRIRPRQQRRSVLTIGNNPGRGAPVPALAALRMSLVSRAAGPAVALELAGAGSAAS